MIFFYFCYIYSIGDRINSKLSASLFFIKKEQSADHVNPIVFQTKLFEFDSKRMELDQCSKTAIILRSRKIFSKIF